MLNRLEACKVLSIYSSDNAYKLLKPDRSLTTDHD